jgi:hypothetical protein
MRKALEYQIDKPYIRDAIKVFGSLIPVPEQ